MVWLLVAFALAIAVFALAHDARSAQGPFTTPATHPRIARDAPIRPEILAGFYSGGAPLAGRAGRETASLD